MTNIPCRCGLREHIQRMIDKCKVRKKEIEEGKYEFPSAFEEERYEYLANLESKLQFMIDHPEREQTV